jgi:hypothetical protein
MPKSLAFPALASAAAACATVVSAALPCLLSVDSSHAADKVGVAAAVTPQASSKPPGQDTRTLKIGNSVVYNERIDTSSSGVVQVTARPSPSGQDRASSSTSSSITRQAAKAHWSRASPKARSDSSAASCRSKSAASR